MMNGFGSECSSGCESGWTMYLDHSASPNPSQRNGDENGFFCEEYYKAKQGKEEDEEEDLSMVSDASSGPPHCHEDEEYFCDDTGCFSSASSASAALAKKTNKRRKIKPPTTKQLQHQHQQYQSLLDDTASSPIFSFSKGNLTLTSQQPSRENVLGFSQGFSASHFNERYAFQQHPDFLQSTLPGKSTSAKPVACRKETGNRIR